MAERAASSRGTGNNVESYVYSAGSYDRLKTNEEELFQLVKLSAVPMDRQLFDVILELLKMNVAPMAILQVIKTLRPEGTPDDIRSHSPIGIPSTSGAQAQDNASVASSDSQSNSESSLPIPIPCSSHILSECPTDTSGGTCDARQPDPAGREGKAKSGQTSKKHKSTTKRSKDLGKAKSKAKEQKKS